MNDWSFWDWFMLVDGIVFTGSMIGFAITADKAGDHLNKFVRACERLEGKKK